MFFLRAIWLAVLIVTVIEAAPSSSANNQSFISTQNTIADSEPTYRLSSNVVPVSYKLKIVTHLEGIVIFPFEGDVNIKIKVKERTNTITLHAKELNITASPIIKTKSKSGVKKNIAKRYVIDSTTDFLRIEFSDIILPGYHRISILYGGILNEHFGGFRRLGYKANRQDLKNLAATSFEPNQARMAFPCFDEPIFKATFNISIKHRADYHAVSNMHVIRTEVDPDNHNQTWTTFAQTPKMSTYLVAFVVSDFHALENDAGNFRILAQKDIIEQGRFALELGPKILDLFENYTGISQKDIGFKKMEFVSLPDPELTAMENWGLVIFRDSYLLVEKNLTNTQSRRLLVSIIISHELAHQWFGNLVTPSWWQYLWLKEGFAKYFEYFMTDKIESKWRLMDLFVIEILQGKAFILDSEETSYAMDHAAPNGGGKDGVLKFNGISYNKASVIIRMISHILTEYEFRKALLAYLQSKNFDVASSSDLFSEFKEKFPDNSVITKEEFNDALVNWESNPGFPIITVTRDYTKNTSTIEQERFLLQNDSSHRERYWVALNYAQTKDCFHKTETEYWMKPTDTSITVPIPDSTTWAIFNKQQFGYYRVNYDVKNWEMIINTLKSEKFQDIHVLNRAQLIDDALNLARISKLDYTIALDLISYLKKENDFVPWKSFWAGQVFLYEQLLYTEYQNDFKAYLLQLLSHSGSQLRSDTNSIEKQLQEKFQSMAYTLACELSLSSCEYAATEEIKKWLNGTISSITVQNICLGMRTADQETWDNIFRQYIFGITQLLGALGCSTDRGILRNFLQMAMNKTGPIPNTDRASAIAGVYMGSDLGTNLVLDFMIENNETINGGRTNDTDNFFLDFWNISKHKSYLGTQIHLDKLKNLKENFKNGPTISMKVIDWMIEQAEVKIKWVEQRGPEFRKYFEGNRKNIDNENKLLTSRMST